MHSVTIEMPDMLAEWVQERVEKEKFADPADYVRRLILREIEQDMYRERTDEELRQELEEASKGPFVAVTLEEIMEKATQTAKQLGIYRE